MTVERPLCIRCQDAFEAVTYRHLAAPDSACSLCRGIPEQVGLVAMVECDRMRPGANVDIRHAVSNPWCWACGNDEHDAPLWYAGPHCIENAHIIGGPGRSRNQRCREAVVLLCSICHRLAHGERLQWSERRECRSLPNLTRGNLLWLKRERDAFYFDAELLEVWAIGVLPELKPPAPHFRNLYRRNRG